MGFFSRNENTCSHFINTHKAFYNNSGENVQKSNLVFTKIEIDSNYFEAT